WKRLINVLAMTLLKKSLMSRIVKLQKLMMAGMFHPEEIKICLAIELEGRYQTLDECLIREYRLTSRAISCQTSSDFCEGVRARMVDKDYAPKWDPPSLEHVSIDMLEQYFSPLSAFEHELELPALQVAMYKAMGTRYHAAETNFKAKMLPFCVLRIM
nr:3-hydroxyisobutyryl-CoA hydrolase-like protein 1, mitochondrial [Tanacetum cinerariifolium]